MLSCRGAFVVSQWNRPSLDRYPIRMSNIPSTRAEVLYRQSSEADRFLPEGPREIMLDGRPALAWVNIQAAPDSSQGDIHVRFWDGEHRTYGQERRPGFLLPTDRANCLLVGREKEIGILNLTDNHFTPLAAIDD